MAAKLTWAQAVTMMGNDEDRLILIFAGDDGSSHPLFDVSLSRADGMARSKISERYAATKYDAWDSTSCPDYVQFHLFSLAAGIATARNEGRAQSIDTYAGIAAGWLDDVAAARARVPELEDETAAQLQTMSGVRTLTPARVFDPDSSTSVFPLIDPPFNTRD